MVHLAARDENRTVWERRSKRLGGRENECCSEILGPRRCIGFARALGVRSFLGGGDRRSVRYRGIDADSARARRGRGIVVAFALVDRGCSAFGGEDRRADLDYDYRNYFGGSRRLSRRSPAHQMDRRPF